MFTIKYKPRTLSEFIGNNIAIPTFTNWLTNWDSNNKKTKCLLISGVNGIGKSLIVELMTQNYNVNHYSTNDELDNSTFTNIISPISQNMLSFNSKKNILLFTDIDAISVHGFISNLTNIIKQTLIPIICICDNRYEQNIKPIIPYCVDLKMFAPSFDTTYPLFYNIIKNENIKISLNTLKNIYNNSNGDIRFILNSLQLYNKNINTNKNIQNNNIFDITKKILNKNLSFDDKYELYWASNDIISLMVHENYISNVNAIDSMNCLSYCADALSDSDIFSFNENDWGFEKHVATSIINCTSKCNYKSNINFTQLLGKTSTINKNRKDKITNNYLSLNIGPLVSEEIEIELKPKIRKSKEPKTKEYKTKETKTKEPKTKETKTKTKETKNKSKN